MLALKARDFTKLCQVDEELTAIRPASAVRTSSVGVGKRLLSLYGSICGDEHFPEYSRMLPHGNAAAAYGIVLSHSGIAEREAAMTFGYNRLAGIVSAGLRLISIGQQQGQALLTATIDRLPDAAKRIVQMADEPLRSFSPVLDIQQMNHRYVYSRLFRS
jgi:urease accessory protein